MNATDRTVYEGLCGLPSQLLGDGCRCAPGQGRESNTSGLTSYDFFFLGIFAPAFRASLRAIATACLRLVTFLPLPDFKEPCLCSFITFSTLRLPFELLLDGFFAITFLRAPAWREYLCKFRANIGRPPT